MNDQELLTYAAKAAGIEVWPHGNRKISKDLIFATKNGNWNPLLNDADAFQLMVKLNFDVTSNMRAICGMCASAYDGAKGIATVPHGEDKYSATRRAIVMASAETGKGM